MAVEKIKFLAGRSEVTIKFDTKVVTLSSEEANDLSYKIQRLMHTELRRFFTYRPPAAEAAQISNS